MNTDQRSAFSYSQHYRVFACDVIAAMLVYLDKRILNIFFWKYTNMAANFFVVLIPKDWVKTLYCQKRLQFAVSKLANFHENIRFDGNKINCMYSLN